MDLHELKEKKRRAQALYGSIPGVLGFGVGDGVINVYIRSPSTQGLLPQEFEGVALAFVVTGDITAL